MASAIFQQQSEGRGEAIQIEFVGPELSGEISAI
jgi:hypothetical protein